MPGRPRLQVGEIGAIRHYKAPAGWQAVANYRTRDGRIRQYARSAPTKHAATLALQGALKDKDREANQVRPSTTMTELAEVYFARLSEDVGQNVVSPGTLRLYQGHWANHGAPSLGNLMVREADVQALDRFLLDLRRAVSPSVAKTMRAVLSGMFGIAARYKAVPTNPVRDVSKIRSGAAKPVRALEPAEAVDLWGKLSELARTPGKWFENRRYRRTVIHPDLPDLALWMLGTSERIGQAVAVHWPWIDLDAATAALGPNVIRVKGEGLRLNWGTTKTRERVLDLPEPVLAMLLLRQQQTLNPMGPVFPDAFGGLRDPSNTSADLRAALDLAGYEWVTSHVFRKTVATVLDDAGLSARHVADQLGHARPSMTQDRYMARKARNPRAVAAIEAMLATSPERRVVPLDRLHSPGCPGTATR